VKLEGERRDGHEEDAVRSLKVPIGQLTQREGLVKSKHTSK
jgi:hypothetical protein